MAKSEQVQIPGAGHGQTVSRRKLERLSRASLYDEVARLEGEKAALEAALRERGYHSPSECSLGSCSRCEPALSGAGEGTEAKLKEYLALDGYEATGKGMEVREQVRRAMEVARSWIDATAGDDIGGNSIAEELRVALDRLGGTK